MPGKLLNAVASCFIALVCVFVGIMSNSDIGIGIGIFLALLALYGGFRSLSRKPE